MLARAIAMSAREEEERQRRLAEAEARRLAEEQAQRRREEEQAQRRREEEQRLEEERRRQKVEEIRRQAEIERQRRLLSSYGGFTSDDGHDADLAVAMKESMKSYEEERMRLEQQAFQAIRRTAELSPDVDVQRVLSGFSDPGGFVTASACVCVCVHVHVRAFIW